jgi:hypothetical protein
VALRVSRKIVTFLTDGASSGHSDSSVHGCSVAAVRRACAHAKVVRARNAALLDCEGLKADGLAFRLPKGGVIQAPND